MTQTVTKRLLLNHARDGHFCSVCGVPATNSCQDARQVGLEWQTDPERYGCDSHPVIAMIYLENGRIIPAKEFTDGY